MKINNFIKFAAAILLLWTVCAVLFSGCTRDNRINTAELERRMAQADDRLAFFDGEVFCCKETYYTYFSLSSEKDVLMTVKEDGYGRVKRVTVTSDEKNASSGGGFVLVCEAAAAALLPEKTDIGQISSAVGLTDTSNADEAGFAEFKIGKVTFWTYRGKNTVTFCVDIE